MFLLLMESIPHYTGSVVILSPVLLHLPGASGTTDQVPGFFPTACSSRFKYNHSQSVRPGKTNEVTITADCATFQKFGRIGIDSSPTCIWHCTDNNNLFMSARWRQAEREPVSIKEQKTQQAACKSKTQNAFFNPSLSHRIEAVEGK